MRQYRSLKLRRVAIMMKASLRERERKKMFSKNLSTSILQLCSSRDLSYEEAAERCDLSPRYFGSIARGQTNVSLSTFEKLCKGFELTPNELLMIPPLSDFRVPMAFISGRDFYPICTCCKLNPDWADHPKAIIVFLD